MIDAPKSSEIVFIARSRKMTDSEEAALLRLYQPILEAKAVSLYLTLVDLAPRDFDNPLLIADLYATTQLIGKEFEHTRGLLEGIGLVETYEKFSSKYGKIYKYILHAPKNAGEFFQDRTLSSFLLHSVGENRFSLLAESFQTDDLDVYGYFPTTREFHEVFGYEVENVVSDEEKLAFAKAKSYELPKKKLEVVGGKFDVSHFKYLLTQLGAKLKDEDINEIYILHELYGLNENNMIELAKDVVEMGDDTLDIERFSKHIRKLSATGAVEKRLHSNEEEVKKEEEEVTVQELQKLGATEAEIQMVKDAQELAPMDFLRKIQREQGVSPSNLEDWLLDDAIRKSPLRASVLNILMHYILVQEKIPSLDYKNQFVEGKREFEKRKIVSVVEAMKFIKEEKTSRNTTKRSYTRNRNQGRKIKMPEWWDQKLETDATSEDIQGMLNNMKNNVDDI